MYQMPENVFRLYQSFQISTLIYSLLTATERKIKRGWEKGGEEGKRRRREEEVERRRWG